MTTACGIATIVMVQTRKVFNEMIILAVRNSSGFEKLIEARAVALFFIALIVGGNAIYFGELSETTSMHASASLILAESS